MKFKFLFLSVILSFLLLACQDEDPAPTPVIIGDIQANAIKILVEADGFYRLDKATLSQAGFDVPDLATVPLTFIADGESIAYLIDDDAFIFYGQAPQDRYTTIQPYLLSVAESDEVATGQMPAFPAPDPTNSALSGLPTTIYLETDAIYRSDARNEADDLNPWFWQKIGLSEVIEFTVNLPASSDGSGMLEVGMWGFTTNADLSPDHDLDILVNGENVGTIQGDVKSLYADSVEIPAGILQAGNNTITLDNSPAGVSLLDITYLDWLKFTYTASPEITSDSFTSDAGTEGTITLSGFSDQPHLFDIANPTHPQLLTDWTYENGEATLSVTADMQLAGVSNDGFTDPAGIIPLRDSDWTNANNQADLIILTTDALIPALQPLVEAREAEGLGVAVIPIDAVYDEFGFGKASPTSITTFLQHATDTWADPKPRYLFLVGEATDDFHNNLGQNPTNIIPPYIVSVEFSGQTTSDSRLADLDGDLTPDLAVGRWTVDTPQAVASLVERTLAYEQSTPNEQAIFTTDGGDDAQQFVNFTNRLLEQTNFPEAQASKLYGSDSETVASEWNEGAWLVTFTGHGSQEQWGGGVTADEAFTVDAIASLTEPSTPIVLQFTCLTGYYANPETQSISEVMLAHPNGPVLLVGASSLTLSSSQSPFAINMVNALQDPSVERVGDAFLLAKQDLDMSRFSLREISDTFNLFGDPSARIVRPATTPVTATE